MASAARPGTQCRAARRRARGGPIIALTLLTLTGAAHAAQWAVPDADTRLCLSVEGDLYTRTDCRLETVIDFNAVLGADRTLRAGSLALIDADSGAPVELELAEDAQIRYASGNPVLRLRWHTGPLGRFEPRRWHLYMGTTTPGAEDAWTRAAQTFLPIPPGLLFESDLESADPRLPDVPLAFSPGGKDVQGEHTDRVWSEEQARSGTHSLKIARRFDDGPPANSNRCFWWTWPPPVEVSEGQCLRLEAWVKTVRVAPQSFASVALEFRDAANARLGNRLFLPAPMQPHDWQPLRGTVMAPAAAAKAVFWFSLHGEGEVYCDDIRITEASGGGLPELPVVVGEREDGATVASAAAQLPETTILKVGTAEQPPVIDGKLDDPCWRTAGVIREMQDFMRVPGTAVQTTILVTADRDALYFGFDCQEPQTDALVANATERDGPVWQDDSVELFLDTNRDLRTYYQIIVNPKGVIFDQDTGAPGLAGREWDGPITAATQVLPDRWLAEVKLEFSGLRLAEAGGTWGANFARTSLRGGRSWYVWTKVERNFGEPARFGTLALPFDPSANVVSGRVLAGPRLYWGAGDIPFEVINKRQSQAQVRLAVSDAAAGTLLAEQRLTVQPRSTTRVDLACSFSQPGEVKLRYELSEESSGRTLYTATQLHQVPDPMSIVPLTLISHLDEDRIAGTYVLGVASQALGDLSLRVSLLPEGASTPAASETLPLGATTGSFALGIAGVGAGRYELRAELLRAGQPLAARTLTVLRKSGPFTG